MYKTMNWGSPQRSRYQHCPPSQTQLPGPTTDNRKGNITKVE